MGTQGPGKMFSESADGQMLYIDGDSGKVPVGRKLTRREERAAHLVSGFAGICAGVWYLFILMSDVHVTNTKTLVVMSWRELTQFERTLVFAHEAAISGIVGALVYLAVGVVVLTIISIRCMNFRQMWRSPKS